MSDLRTSMLVSAPLCLAGCNTVIWGNLGVLCVTVGIFLGTVFLSRSTSGNRNSTRSSASSTTSRS